MKKLTLLILMLTAFAGAFAKTAKRKKKQPAGDIVSVSMHRTVCYGKCPDFTIDINKDGTATYTAKRFTPDTGIFKKNIGKQKAGEIIAMFKTYKVDTCREMYENRLPDLPGLNMAINYKKGKKQIFSAEWGPLFLKEIAAAMEESGLKPEGDATWKKVGMPKMD